VRLLNEKSPERLKTQITQLRLAEVMNLTALIR